jgi:Icc-related predicted phosphoesterase
MRRFLVCGGIHSRPSALEALRRAARLRQPEAVLFVGGVGGGLRQYAARGTTPWALTHADALFIERFFEALGELGVFAAVVPGPADTPLEEFLRIGMHAEVDFPGVHLVHATLVQKGDVAVCGVGGRIGTEAVYDGDTCSRTLVEYHLRSLRAARQPHRVLLLAAPPRGALGGDDGSSLVGELIDSHHPSLCAVGGPDGRRGSQRVARTLVINPGHLAEGSAAWLDLGRPVEEAVEFLDLRHPGGTGAAAELGVCD